MMKPKKKKQCPVKVGDEIFVIHYDDVLKIYKTKVLRLEDRLEGEHRIYYNNGANYITVNVISGRIREGRDFGRTHRELMSKIQGKIKKSFEKMTVNK